MTLPDPTRLSCCEAGHNLVRCALFQGALKKSYWLDLGFIALKVYIEFCPFCGKSVYEEEIK
jgi:hypothetical protein